MIRYLIFGTVFFIILPCYAYCELIQDNQSCFKKVVVPLLREETCDTLPSHIINDAIMELQYCLLTHMGKGIIPTCLKYGEKNKCLGSISTKQFAVYTTLRMHWQKICQLVEKDVRLQNLQQGIRRMEMISKSNRQVFKAVHETIQILDSMQNLIDGTNNFASDNLVDPTMIHKVINLGFHEFEQLCNISRKRTWNSMNEIFKLLTAWIILIIGLLVLLSILVYKAWYVILLLIMILPFSNNFVGSMGNLMFVLSRPKFLFLSAVGLIASLTFSYFMLQRRTISKNELDDSEEEQVNLNYDENDQYSGWDDDYNNVYCPDDYYSDAYAPFLSYQDD